MAGFNIAAALADVSKLDTNSQTVTMIDVDDLVSNSANFYAVQDLDSLIDSIALSGLLDPVTVTPIAEQPGKYRIISGHRRTAAIRALVNPEEGKGREDLRKVPCFVRSAASAAMEELELIYANATARVLTSAETMHQAERVERLLYDLKEQGVEFPGRMRDHVAQACSVSKTKLANLKIIREHLPQVFMTAFDGDRLSDQTALFVAQLPDDLRSLVAKCVKHPDKCIAANIKDIADHADFYRAPNITCPDKSPCINGDRMLARTVNAPYSWQACDKHCCLHCGYRDSCSFSCERCRKIRLESKEREKREQAKTEAALQKKYDAYKRKSIQNAQRLLDAAEAAGVGLPREIYIDRPYAPYTPKEIKDVAANKDLEKRTYYAPSYCLTINDKCVELTRKLHTTLDYLAGLTDDPAGIQGYVSVDERKPYNGQFVFAYRGRGEHPVSSVYWRDQFMDAGDRSTGNCKLNGIKWWMPQPPLPDGAQHTGAEVLADIKFGGEHEH